MAYLLRVVLPDRPGALGALATALGRVGADIVGLDVVERTPTEAVDDLLVELPAGGLADTLLTAVATVDGAGVESLRPFQQGADLRRDLELVDGLAETPADGLGILVRGVPGVFRAGWALLVEQSPAGGRPGVLGTSPAAPDVSDLSLPWLPLPAARRLPAAEPWVPGRWRDLGTELAAAPVGGPSRAVLLGRPGGPRFRSAELLRLAHLAGIAATVTAAAAT
jgi:hypothetical protein